jgi:hypothetical protein
VSGFDDDDASRVFGLSAAASGLELSDAVSGAAEAEVEALAVGLAVGARRFGAAVAEALAVVFVVPDAEDVAVAGAPFLGVAVLVALGFGTGFALGLGVGVGFERVEGG